MNLLSVVVRQKILNVQSSVQFNFIYSSPLVELLKNIVNCLICVKGSMGLSGFPIYPFVFWNYCSSMTDVDTIDQPITIVELLRSLSSVMLFRVLAIIIPTITQLVFSLDFSHFTDFDVDTRVFTFSFVNLVGIDFYTYLV